MGAPLILSSFTAGELSPTLHGRVDLNKYRIGAALLRNFYVDYRGGATRRPGTRFVGRCINDDKKIRLIPFQFSNKQTYILEFSHLKMRVVMHGGFVTTTGGVIYSRDTPYTSDDLAQIKFTQSADVMTLVHPKYAPQELTRLAHDNWVLNPILFGATILPPSSVQVVINGPSTAPDPQTQSIITYGYAVTAVGANGGESVMSAMAITTGYDMTLHRSSAQINWTQVAGAQYYNVYKATAGANATMVPGQRMGFVGSTQAVQFIDANIIPDYTKSSPNHRNPFAPSRISEIIINTAGSSYNQYASTVLITDSTGTGAYAVPVVAGGGIYSIVVYNGGSNYTAPVVQFGGPSGEGATVASIKLTPATGCYPSTVAYFQQRLLFGGTDNSPSTLWGSKPGAFHNFDYGIPTNDSDSYEFTLASQQVNAIKYMIGMPGGLVILTAGGAWQLSGGQQYAPVTATSVLATPQAYNGCGDLQPIVIGYEILYVQAAGAIVRDLSYNFFANIYTGSDMTVLSNHFFHGYQLVDWCYSEEPQKIIWAIRNDGKLLSFTFLKDQEVAGWAMHETNGLYHACCSIREGDEDAIYFVVSRLIGGAWVKYLERAASQLMPNGIEDAWYLDCALDNNLIMPTATLYPSTILEKGMSFVTSAAAFEPWMADGAILRAGGGIYKIKVVDSPTQVHADEIRQMQSTFRDDDRPTGPFIVGTPQPAGAWSISVIVDELSGLDHLEGEWVTVLADGNVVPPKQVIDGKIVLEQQASKIIVGLNYWSWLKTLRLESEPTVQSRRKKISAVTVRLNETRGLKIGHSWETLYEAKERPSSLDAGLSAPAIVGDMRVTQEPQWDAEGQVCVRCEYPLPASVVAVIMDTVLGDTP